ncbi:traB domain-containing protein [Euwallacea similis]|uniref:traB domain-containing protein n=1 Tax=Euwallacea similis TaxID=1736056 RepID=UPI00344B89F7
MDKSLSSYELTDSTIKAADSESGSGSDKSEAIEIVGYGDVESSSSNSNKSDDFDSNLPDTVTLLTHKETGAKLYLVGTAHFSRESQADVELVIRQVQPQIVIVELCPSRTSILDLDESTILEEAKNVDMSKIIATIRSNGAINGLMYLLLLNMSAHITKEIGMAPGGEFRVAYREAKKIPNCCIHLGDRPIGITMRRALSRLTWFQTIKLAWHLITSKDPISIEEIEKCKNRDMLEQLLADLAGEYPAFREVFLDERDIFLTNCLQNAAANKPKSKPGEIADEQLKIVGVVGIGHTPGIIRLWPVEQRPFAAQIMEIPPPSLASKIVKYSFRITLLGFGGYLVYKVVPIPLVLRSKIEILAQQVVSSVRINPSVKYSLN